MFGEEKQKVDGWWDIFRPWFLSFVKRLTITMAEKYPITHPPFTVQCGVGEETEFKTREKVTGRRKKRGEGGRRAVATVHRSAICNGKFINLSSRALWTVVI